MNSRRRPPPVWLTGLSNASLGFSNGIILFVMPQLMAAVHVPESKIAAITAIGSSPSFWFVLFGPILDVRFSHRRLSAGQREAFLNQYQARRFEQCGAAGSLPKSIPGQEV
jgi:hypothetical protein